MNFHFLSRDEAYPHPKLNKTGGAVNRFTGYRPALSISLTVFLFKIRCSHSVIFHDEIDVNGCHNDGCNYQCHNLFPFYFNFLIIKCYPYNLFIFLTGQR